MVGIICDMIGIEVINLYNQYQKNGQRMDKEWTKNVQRMCQKRIYNNITLLYIQLWNNPI